MCSPRFFQSTRDACVAISPAPIRNSIKENAADPNTARRLSVALGLFVFDQLEDAPQNQQRRPEARKERSQVVDIHDPHGAQQEQDADQDQHTGPAIERVRSARWQAVAGSG
jgi:hypothetical protein